MMAVFVDALQPTPRCRRLPVSCHMMADSNIELERLARAIGLRPEWRQGDHYDLSPSKRRLAVKRGAIEVPGVLLVRLRQAKRKGNQWQQ